MIIHHIICFMVFITSLLIGKDYFYQITIIDENKLIFHLFYINIIKKKEKKLIIHIKNELLYIFEVFNGF